MSWYFGMVMCHTVTVWFHLRTQTGLQTAALTVLYVSLHSGASSLSDTLRHIRTRFCPQLSWCVCQLVHHHHHQHHHNSQPEHAATLQTIKKNLQTIFDPISWLLSDVHFMSQRCQHVPHFNSQGGLNPPGQMKRLSSVPYHELSLSFKRLNENNSQQTNRICL